MINREQKIAILNYSAGNLRSISQAITYCKSIPIHASDEKSILDADKLILPGVGNFGKVIDFIYKNKLDVIIQKFIQTGKPVLGICLGMQILFQKSEEAEGMSGLGILKGNVKILKASSNRNSVYKVPNIGWSSIKVEKTSRLIKKNIVDPMYFLHSYYVVPEDQAIISSTFSFCDKYLVSSIEKNNIYAVQFHPEKSRFEGLNLIKQFITL